MSTFPDDIAARPSRMSETLMPPRPALRSVDHVRLGGFLPVSVCRVVVPFGVLFITVGRES
jgi:hypothetical protein